MGIDVVSLWPKADQMNPMQLAIKHALLSTIVSIVLCVIVFAISYIFGHDIHKRLTGFLASILCLGVVLYGMFGAFSLGGSKSVPFIIPLALTTIGISSFTVSRSGSILNFAQLGLPSGVLVTLGALGVAALIHLIFLRVIFRRLNE